MSDLKRTRCELAWDKPSRNRPGCYGDVALEGRFLLCQGHREMVDRIVAAANRRINAVRNERRCRKAA